MRARRFTHSLLTQIVLSLSLTACATIVLIGAWFYWQFENATGNLSHSTLVSRADRIAQHLSVEPGGTVALSLPPAMLEAYKGHGGHYRFSIRDEAGHILFTSPEPTGVAPRHVTKSEDGTLYRDRDWMADPPRRFGVARVVKIGDRRLLLQVEEATTDQFAMIRAMLEVALEKGGWLFLPLLLIPLGVSLFIIRRALAPVTALSRQAVAIGPSATDVRLPEMDVPLEILPLVRAVNLALDRLSDGFRAQREFAAGAAHELRTPLAVLRAQVDTLPCAATAEALRKDIAVMAHMTEQLLRVAQADSLAVGSDEAADLNAVAAEVVGYLARLAIRRGKAIGLVEAESPALVHGSREAIFHALRNLADNALTHTAPGSEVTVWVRTEEQPSVSVRDHGPGVPPDLRERIFERFWRADRRGSGAGLGLAIVRKVMERHGGRVTVEDAPGGGAMFTMWFPKPTQPRPT